MVTAPLDKQSVSAAKDTHFTGQTGYIQAYANADNSLMMMVSDVMKVALTTEHLSLAEVPSAITQELIQQKIRLLFRALVEDFNCATQKIAVLALNPHNGDRGLLGHEEKDVILPSIQSIQSEISTVFGPYAADGFFGLHQYKKFDATLAMYHDQGLIPFKATNFDGVNFTAGLPIIRTSPDHGPAYDIVGTNNMIIPHLYKLYTRRWISIAIGLPIKILPSLHYNLNQRALNHKLFLFLLPINFWPWRTLRDFKIPWVGLKNGEHLFHFEINESFFSYFDQTDYTRCDIQIDLKFQKSEHLFILKFEIDGWIELPCDRCLSPYQQSLFDDAEVWVKFATNLEEKVKTRTRQTACI